MDRMQKRNLGITNIQTAPIVLGGHGFTEFMGRPRPSMDEAARVVSFLAEKKLTHFDCTYSAER